MEWGVCTSFQDGIHKVTSSHMEQISLAYLALNVCVFLKPAFINDSLVVSFVAVCVWIGACKHF